MSPVRIIHKNATEWLHRPLRYITTYWWFFALHFKLFPFAFPFLLSSGVGARFANIMSLIVSMKCAVWLIQLDVSNGHIKNLQLDVAVVAPILILIPVLLAALAIVAEQTHRTTNTYVQRGIISYLADTEMEKHYNSLTLVRSTTGLQSKNEDDTLEALKSAYQRSRRVQERFIQVFLASAVLILLLAVGFFLNPPVMLIFLGGAIPLLATFVVRRHAASQESQKIQQELTTQVVEIEKIFKTALDSNLQHGRATKPTPHEIYVQRTNDLNLQSEQFQAKSETLMNIGQATIICLFLWYIHWSYDGQNDVAKLGSIVIVLMLIRYAIAQIRIIAIMATRIAIDYPFLVRIKAATQNDLTTPESH